MLKQEHLSMLCTTVKCFCWPVISEFSTSNVVEGGALMLQHQYTL